MKVRLTSEERVWEDRPLQPGTFRIIQGIWGLGDEAVESYFVRDADTLGEAQQALLHGREGRGVFWVDNDQRQTVFALQHEGAFADPRVVGLEFFRADEVGGHTDERREITDVVVYLHGKFLTAVTASKLLQTKTIAMTEQAVDTGMVVGNHYHINDRHELFVARGQEGTPLFVMNYSLPDTDTIGTFEMHHGDACYLPPGVTHAFTPRASGAELVGFSNLPFRPDDDIKHVIA